MTEIFQHTKKNVLQFLRKLTLSNLKTSRDPEPRYEHQRNSSAFVIAPTARPVVQKRGSRKKGSRKCKNKCLQDESDSDCMFTARENKMQERFRNCIKRFNNNYEKQRNCLQDDNMVFTDNKIYVSLASRNSSLTSSFSGCHTIKKRRRVIYPTVGGRKTDGFLRNYDFNYESPTKEKAESPIDDEENLNTLEADLTSISSALNSVVFEKVTVHRIMDLEGNSDDLEENGEDDIQWKNFLKLRVQESRSVQDETSGMSSPDFDDSGIEVNSPLSPERLDNTLNEELEYNSHVHANAAGFILGKNFNF